MSAEEREFLRSKVPELGLETPYKDGTVRDLALEVLSISRRGLERRAQSANCKRRRQGQRTPLVQGGRCGDWQ